MQSIEESSQKIKYFLEGSLRDWGLIFIVFLVSIGSFGLGRLSVLELVNPVVSIEESKHLSQYRGMYIGGLYIAAKGGSYYYYPWCAGATKITADGAMWFQTEQDAQSAGFLPGKNCKGLGVE